MGFEGGPRKEGPPLSSVISVQGIKLLVDGLQSDIFHPINDIFHPINEKK